MHDIAAHDTTTPLSPVAQDPRGLMFGVLSTPHLPCEVRIVREQHVQLDGADVRLRIIGESHWITLSHQDGSLLHEMLACVSLPPAACVVHQSFAELQPFQHQQVGYSASVRFMPMQHRLVGLGAGQEQIEVVFPRMLSDDCSPFTRIWWTVSAEIISWRTIHVYPGTSGPLAVLTESHHSRSAARQTVFLQDDDGSPHLSSRAHSRRRALG